MLSEFQYISFTVGTIQIMKIMQAAYINQISFNFNVTVSIYKLILRKYVSDEKM